MTLEYMDKKEVEDVKSFLKKWTGMIKDYVNQRNLEEGFQIEYPHVVFGKMTLEPTISLTISYLKDVIK